MEIADAEVGLDRRVRRTRGALRAALLELTREHGLAGLSVARVALRAGVTRPTFYDHYRDLDDLAVDALRGELHGLAEVSRRAGELVAGEGQGPPAGLCRLVAFFHEHRTLLARVLGPDGSLGFASWLQRRMAQDVEEALRHAPRLADPGVPTDVEADFVAGALLAVLVPRLAVEPPPEPGTIAAQLWRLLDRDAVGAATAGGHDDPHASTDRDGPHTSSTTKKDRA